MLAKETPLAWAYLVTFSTLGTTSAARNFWSWPTTMTCSTKSDSPITSSIGLGSTFSPPSSTTVSLARPTMRISWLWVSRTRSPVLSHPSRSTVWAVSSGFL